MTLQRDGCEARACWSASDRSFDLLLDQLRQPLGVAAGELRLAPVLRELRQGPGGSGTVKRT
jgi:hypothetical protein